jgi:chemotaxis protein methyltransferase CheR
MEKISDLDYDFLREVSEEWMGSVFGKDKKYLFENRLMTMAKKFSYGSIAELVKDMRSLGKRYPRDKKAFFVDLITTHETLFFRDKTPFKTFKEVILPDLLKRGAGRLQIYSAACSTGQEPVSLAIQLSELIQAQSLSLDYNIYGVDISDAVVQYAKQGIYSQYEVQRGLPVKLLSKYFEQNDGGWKLKSDLLRRISYQEENLLMPKPKPYKFDLVLCRNVTIYMDAPKVRKVYQAIHAQMKPGAWLIIGHSERMTDHSDLFEFVKTDAGIVYQRK